MSFNSAFSVNLYWNSWFDTVNSLFCTNNKVANRTLIINRQRCYEKLVNEILKCVGLNGNELLLVIYFVWTQADKNKRCIDVQNDKTMPLIYYMEYDGTVLKI